MLKADLKVLNTAVRATGCYVAITDSQSTSNRYEVYIQSKRLVWLAMKGLSPSCHVLGQTYVLNPPATYDWTLHCIEYAICAFHIVDASEIER
jgi:hypothetical protein